MEWEACRESRTGEGQALPQAALGQARPGLKHYCAWSYGEVTGTLAKAGWAERWVPEPDGVAGPKEEGKEEWGPKDRQASQGVAEGVQSQGAAVGRNGKGRDGWWFFSFLQHVI